jgi:hypothetical protein
MSDIVVIFVSLFMLLLVLTVYYTYASYRRHSRGDLSLDDSSTVLDGLCLLAAFLVLAAPPDIAGILGTIGAVAIVMFALLRGIDRATLSLANRQTESTPSTKRYDPARYSK